MKKVLFVLLVVVVLAGGIYYWQRFENTTRHGAYCIQLEENGPCKTLEEVTCEQVCLSPWGQEPDKQFTGGHCSFEQCDYKFITMDEESGVGYKVSFAGGRTSDCRKLTKTLEDGKIIIGHCCCEQ